MEGNLNVLNIDCNSSRILSDMLFSSPDHEVLKVSYFRSHFVRRASSTIALLTLYMLHFASDLHESLLKHSSPSNLGQVPNWAIWGQKLGHKIKLKENLLNTLEATFLTWKY